MDLHSPGGGPFIFALDKVVRGLKRRERLKKFPDSQYPFWFQIQQPNYFSYRLAITALVGTWVPVQPGQFILLWVMESKQDSLLQNLLMVQWMHLRKALCLSNEVFCFLHVSLNSKSIYWFPLYPWSYSRHQPETWEPQCQLLPVRTEEVWATDHCLSRNHKIFHIITYG